MDIGHLKANRSLQDLLLPKVAQADQEAERKLYTLQLKEKEILRRLAFTK